MVLYLSNAKPFLDWTVIEQKIINCINIYINLKNICIYF